MDRRTVRLVNAIGYRTKLSQSLPDIKAELISRLEDGEEVRTRGWIIVREGHCLRISANTLGPSYQSLLLPFRSPKESHTPQDI